MEYFLEIERKEILPFATTWMELEGICGATKKLA